jgi:hypothetical protein
MSATKSTQQITKEEVDKAIKELTAAPEAGMYGVSTPTAKLLDVLAKTWCEVCATTTAHCWWSTADGIS